MSREDQVTLHELAQLDRAGSPRVRREVRSIRNRLGSHQQGECGGQEECPLCRVEAAERRSA